MTNHIHLIAKANEDNIGLSEIVRDFKKHTSKEILKWLLTSNKESRKEWMQMVFKYHANLNSNNTEYQVWQQKSRPKIIIQSRFALQKLNYIHYNPVRAGFVDQPEDYPYSSYKSYFCEEKNNVILPVKILFYEKE
jgi:REP element-mobilizing transposase RayT